MVTVAPPALHDGFLRRWAVATAVGAAIVSACDAVLLERSKGFFTGGFLSVDRLEGARDAVLFLTASLLVDAAVVGLITASVAWPLLRTRLRPPAATCAGLLAAVGGLMAANLVSYEILRYFGDAFDVGLMFDLTGGSVAEMAAVAMGHLLRPAVFAAAGMTAAAGIVFVTHRYSTADHPARPRASVLAVPALMAVAGVVTFVASVSASDTLENGLVRKPAGQAAAWLVSVLTDVDRDGYGMVGRMVDPAPFDNAIFPYAVDVPGNGIDEDGIGGDLPAQAAIGEPRPATGLWRQHPDVVLVVLESFRADLVGARVNGVSVTPVLDALAARGASLRNAYSHNGYTVQSRYHLLAGRLAGSHAAGTLIDDFANNGYTVGYFSGQDESFGGTAYDVGFARAHAASDARADRTRRYSTSTTAGSLAVPMSVVQERAAEFLDAQAGSHAPLFLYVNFHDTHFPYSHDGIAAITGRDRLPRGRIVPEERDALWATYANTAANVDRAIGQLLAAVGAARGRAPAVIVTADHGESLFDEGFLGHGYALNEVQTRIPLIAANLALELPDPFGQVDLRPAIAAALSRDASGAPTVVPRGQDTPVFQYLGEITRPRQIAFVHGTDRFTYDFRSRRVRRPDGAWASPADLPAPERDEFVRLVHSWERLNLAARRASGLR